MFKHKKLEFQDLGITFLFLVIAYGASMILLKYTGDENNSALIFVLACLVISALTNGYFWGISASIVSTFCVNYYFMHPYQSFNVTTSGYPVALISTMGVSLVTCTLATVIKNEAQHAIRREIQARELFEQNRQLSEERTKILIESEKEKMRSNLLRAISHDLRTPLTTIIGSSSLIIEDMPNMEDAEILHLLQNIKDDSEWLLTMVENLLSVTKLQPGETELKTHPEIVEDVISSAIVKVHQRFPAYNIEVELPDSILVAPMDPILITQLIINLTENAIRHSGDTEHITVACYEKNHFAVIEVRDRGRGLQASEDPETPSDSTKGLGIGLPVCHSIAKAHKGFLESENREGGGTIFRFGLPLQDTENDN